MSELVWCIPREVWDEYAGFEGFREDNQGDIYRMLLKYGQFKERDSVEEDFSFKQVIPQGLLRFEDNVYVNQRLPKQTETRLLYAYSLGVGGHLNPEDDMIEHMDLIQLGLHREMAEEVEVPMPFSLKYIGITNDEQAEVSRVHVGVWFEISLMSPKVRVRETEKLRGFWANVNELKETSSNFESWARMLYEFYLNKP